MKIRISMDDVGGWLCLVCNKSIAPTVEENPITKEQTLLPISLYWNEQKQRAYCSPECSLIDYGDRKVV